jgi:hypothetical protein
MRQEFFSLVVFRLAQSARGGELLGPEKMAGRRTCPTWRSMICSLLRSLRPANNFRQRFLWLVSTSECIHAHCIQGSLGPLKGLWIR